jgi:hypothetical protein
MQLLKENTRNPIQDIRSKGGIEIEIFFFRVPFFSSHLAYYNFRNLVIVQEECLSLDYEC